MSNRFEMVAKTLQGLEEVLAEELRSLGAVNVEPGNRMVSFEGDLELLYRSNMACRTALRILKPIYKFIAHDTDSLYEMVKEVDWSEIITPGKTFSIDSVVNSSVFTNSLFVTYRVKDGIADWFTDRYGEGNRPGVRLKDADVLINVHIDETRVTLSLDSSGESLHRRGYRVAQTEAPINEVLAAGIILKSGWRGDCPLVDPMCGSGTFLIEAALIAANIMPGIYRKGFAFENWPDFDAVLLERIYNDDSEEREFDHKIYGGDISPKAIAIATENIKNAGVAKYITLEQKSISAWTDAPEDGIPGVLVTNPPYGERISVEDMDGLYSKIGDRLKHVFTGYHAWIIGYKSEYFNKIGLSASTKTPMKNGSLDCELREFVIFEGAYSAFRAEGGRLREDDDDEIKLPGGRRARLSDKEWKSRARRQGQGGKEARRSEGDDRRDFKRDSKRDFKHDAGKRDGKFAKGRGDKGYGQHGYRADVDDERYRDLTPEQEKMLNRHRNPHALKSITNKRPSLPKNEGPIMRERGWKRRGDNKK
ncbi:MAG: RNA methyltransferase [Muribaculaceae bacterium]|nr:RNA methyltransferase [Muribaculaceae bacterium]